MANIVEQGGGRRPFDDLAEIHHHRMVSHVADGGKIVRHQKIRHVVFRLDVLQEVHHLGPD